MECSSKYKTDEIEKLFISAAKLGIGMNKRQSSNKRGLSTDIDSDKSKCNIS